MLAVWLLHGLLYVALLPVLTPTVAHVDANSADIMQRAFALAYQYKNPPVYEWLELAVQAVIGPGPRSFLVVRYAVMGAMGMAVYALVARASESRPQGAAASFGLMSFYWFAWYFHDSISHSILVALACVLFLMVVLRWLREPTVGAAALLGLATGFGLLAKLNFAVLIAGVLATVALDPVFRRRLVDRRLLLSLLIAVAMVTPILMAGASLGKGVTAVIYDQVVDADAGWLMARLRGGGLLLVHYVLFLLPWGLVAWFAFRKRPGDVARPAADPEAERFLRRLAVTTAILVFIGVVAVGARSVSERYLFPVLLAAPFYIHIAWGRRVDEVRQVRNFGGVALGVLVLVLLVRLFNVSTATYGDDENKRYDPYDRLAAALTDLGLGNAFYIASDRYEAGNLMAFLPGARAAGLVTQRRWIPESYPAGGRCVLFYRGQFETDGPRQETAPVPEVLAPFMPDDGVVDTVRAPWRRALVGAPRTGVFHIVDLGANAEACRTVFGAASE